MKLETNTVINRPVEAVWAYISDFETMPLWSTGTIETRLISEPPVRKGSTYVWVGQFLGRRMEVTSEVTEFEPNRAWAYKTISGPFASAARYSLEPLNGGTRVTISAEGDVSGFFKLAEPVMAAMTKRQFEGALANLKDILEAQG
jgi:uncharacterized protein YndB with AHSA1/START domain